MSASFSVNSWILLFHHYASIGILKHAMEEKDQSKESVSKTATKSPASNLTAATVTATNQSEASKTDLMMPNLNATINKKYSRVIFVDDDSLTNMLNKKIIQSINPNIPISTFMEVDEALNFLKEVDQHGDILIFLDINFPIKNGWDFLEEYRLFKTHSTVIMLSSSIDQQDKMKTKNYAQVVDYVSKPLSFEYVAKVFVQN